MIIIGKTSINKAAALAMGETDFKNSMRGKISVNLNELWIQIAGTKAEESKDRPDDSDRFFSHLLPPHPDPGPAAGIISMAR